HVTGVQTCALPILVYPGPAAFRRVKREKRHSVPVLAAKQRLEDVSDLLHSGKLVYFLEPSILDVAAPQVDGPKLLRVVGSAEDDLLARREDDLHGRNLKLEQV